MLIRTWCINKIDRPEARPAEVVDEVLELFMDLDASDEQLDCPFVYASAKTGIASLDPDTPGKDMTPLFETILHSIPAPEGDPEAPTQVLDRHDGTNGRFFDFHFI